MRDYLKKNLGWIIFWAIASNYTINSWIMFAQSFRMDYVDNQIAVLEKRADPQILEGYRFNFPNSVDELKKIRDDYEKASLKSAKRSAIFGYFCK